VAKALKKKFPKVKIIGVRAAEKFHKIEGIGSGKDFQKSWIKV
jgi:cysteine synthase